MDKPISTPKLEITPSPSGDVGLNTFTIQHSMDIQNSWLRFVAMSEKSS
jgi:hypothetical protein